MRKFKKKFVSHPQFNKKNKKNITNLKIKFKLHKNCIKSINKVMYCKKQFLIYITIKRQ